MSGRRPLIKGYFAALRLIVGAVMSSAGFVTLAGFTCFYRPLLAQCDNAVGGRNEVGGNFVEGPG
jgi:hypothetical protein